VSKPPPRDPFAPVDGVVHVILWLILALMGLVVTIWVVGAFTDSNQHPSVATIGESSACATVDTNELVISDSHELVGGLQPHASATARRAEICLQHPTLWQKAASAVRPVGELVFTVGGLLLIRRVIAHARRQGLFTDGVTRSTRQLGWFLLVMTLLYPFLAAAGEGVVVSAAVKGVGWAQYLFQPQLNVTTVIVALGVITFARVLRWAVPLQEEVDATV
jgi:hypothetical protein